MSFFTEEDFPNAPPAASGSLAYNRRQLAAIANAKCDAEIRRLRAALEKVIAETGYMGCSDEEMDFAGASSLDPKEQTIIVIANVARAALEGK